jgi:hypothetical protein
MYNYILKNCLRKTNGLAYFSSGVNNEKAAQGFLGWFTLSLSLSYRVKLFLS